VALGCVLTACGEAASPSPSGQDTSADPSAASLPLLDLTDVAGNLSSTRLRLADQSQLRLDVTEVSSNSLLIAASIDQPGPQGRAYVRATVVGPRASSLAYGVLAVTSVLTGTMPSGSVPPMESLAINFTEVTIPYTQQPNGGPPAGAPQPATVIAFTSLSTSVISLTGGADASKLAMSLVPALGLPNTCPTPGIAVVGDTAVLQ
jgi:hypothetical protein